MLRTTVGGRGKVALVPTSIEENRHKGTSRRHPYLWAYLQCRLLCPPNNRRQDGRCEQRALVCGRRERSLRRLGLFGYPLSTAYATRLNIHPEGSFESLLHSQELGGLVGLTTTIIATALLPFASQDEVETEVADLGTQHQRGITDLIDEIGQLVRQYHYTGRCCDHLIYIWFLRHPGTGRFVFMLPSALKTKYSSEAGFRGGYRCGWWPEL